MTTAIEIIRRAANGPLNDPAFEQWSVSRLLGYLSDGVKALARIAPQAFVVTERVVLSPGAQQRLPAGGVRLIDVPVVIDSAGNTTALTRFNRRAMDIYSPQWRDTAPGTPRQWSPDPADPYVFWVYPPAAAGVQADIEHVKVPESIKQNEVLSIERRYEPALFDYILARAFSEDAEYAGDTARAGAHYAAFERIAKADANP